MPTPYIYGQLNITRVEGGRFIIEGFCEPGDGLSDHLQLICEALVIAAGTTDAFASQFAAFGDELLSLTSDWHGDEEEAA